jgi:hypothetical protein
MLTTVDLSRGSLSIAQVKASLLRMNVVMMFLIHKPTAGCGQCHQIIGTQ